MTVNSRDLRREPHYDGLDIAMIKLASNRGRVLYLDNRNNEYLVTLIGWRGTAGNRARIQLPSGALVTVGTHLVRPVPESQVIVS
jgi:hypothetical protein